MTRLGDVCEKIGSGATPRGGKEAYKDAGIPIIRSQNIHDWVFQPDGLAFLDDEQAESLSNVEVRSNDVLLNITGDSVARACIVPSERIPARVNQHVAIVRAGKEINPTYLLASLQSKKTTLLSLASSGATRNALTKRMIENLDIDLPSREMQDSIAQVLDSIQYKITLINRLNDYLLDLLKSSAKNLYLKHEKNIQEKLPSGWRWVSIGEIADMVCRGIAPKYSLESDEIILGQTCIRNNLVLTENGRSHAPKKLTDKWLRKYDLLINSTGVGSLGRTAQVWFEPSKLVVDSHVTIVRATDKKNALYLGSWAFEHERYIESLHTGSTGQTELPRDRVKAIRVVLPDAGTLDEFNAIAEPSVKMIVANQEENKRLIEIRDTLLPKLMSGAIDVSKVDLTQLTNNHLSDC